MANDNDLYDVRELLRHQSIRIIEFYRPIRDYTDIFLEDRHLAAKFLYALAVAFELGAHISFSNDECKGFILSITHVKIAYDFLRKYWSTHLLPFIHPNQHVLQCFQSPDMMIHFIEKARLSFFIRSCPDASE